MEIPSWGAAARRLTVIVDWFLVGAAQFQGGLVLGCVKKMCSNATLDRVKAGGAACPPTDVNGRARLTRRGVERGPLRMVSEKGHPGKPQYRTKSEAAKDEATGTSSKVASSPH